MLRLERRILNHPKLNTAKPMLGLRAFHITNSTALRRFDVFVSVHRWKNVTCKTLKICLGGFLTSFICLKPASSLSLNSGNRLAGHPQVQHGGLATVKGLSVRAGVHFAWPYRTAHRVPKILRTLSARNAHPEFNMES